MVVINKKRIQIIVSCVLVSLLVFSIQVGTTKNNTINTNETNNLIETTSTPVSGKTVILDAGHGVPDEGDFELKLDREI